MAKADTAQAAASALPIRTTVEDIDAICGYLAKKPTGATFREAKAVLDPKHLDNRKITALKRWGLLDETEDKMKLLDLGRRAVKDERRR